MGTKDRDFPDPAGEAAVIADIVGAEVEMIEAAGHYPHAEFPDRTARLIIDFARASGGVFAPATPAEARLSE
jgi:pimeloyl-ACP methyl ester carboxylesterase